MTASITPRTCSVLACDRQSVARGLCSKHYRRALKAEKGLPQRPTVDLSPDERFDFYTLTGPHPTGCHEWTGCRFANGYGKFKLNDKHLGAHRYALERKLGRPIQPGLQTLHSCDNRPCVNPDHLSEGTNQENVDDRNRKDRQAKGEHNGRAKLTAEDVHVIRYLAREGGKGTQAWLTRLTGIPQRTISDIATHTGWKHLPERPDRLQTAARLRLIAVLKLRAASLLDEEPVQPSNPFIRQQPQPALYRSPFDNVSLEGPAPSLSGEPSPCL